MGAQMKEVERERVQRGDPGRGGKVEKRGGVNDGGELELSREDWERGREPGRVQHANKFTTEARGKSLSG